VFWDEYIYIYTVPGVGGEAEQQVDEGQAREVLPQVQHLGVGVVMQGQAHGDALTAPPIEAQVKPRPPVTVTREAAWRVDTRAVTRAQHTLIHIWNTLSGQGSNIFTSKHTTL